MSHLLNCWNTSVTMPGLKCMFWELLFPSTCKTLEISFHFVCMFFSNYHSLSSHITLPFCFFFSDYFMLLKLLLYLSFTLYLKIKMIDSSLNKVLARQNSWEHELRPWSNIQKPGKKMYNYNSILWMSAVRADLWSMLTLKSVSRKEL